MHEASVADPAGGEARQQQHRDHDDRRIGDPGGAALAHLELGDVAHEADRADPDRDGRQQHEAPGPEREIARLGQDAEDRQGRQHARLRLAEGDPGGGAHHDCAAQQHRERPHGQQRQQGELEQQEHETADEPGRELVEERGLGGHVRERQDDHQQHPGADEPQQRDQRGARDGVVGGGQQAEHPHPRHGGGRLATQRPQQADQPAADRDERAGDERGGDHRGRLGAAADRREHRQADRVGPGEGGEGHPGVAQRPDAQHAVVPHQLQAPARPAQGQRGQEHQEDLEADGRERHRPVDHPGAEDDPAAVAEHEDAQGDQHGVQRGGARGGARDLRGERRHDHHGERDAEHGQRREESAHQGRRDAVAVCAHAMLLGVGEGARTLPVRGLSPVHGRTSAALADGSGDGTRVTARRAGGDA